MTPKGPGLTPTFAPRLPGSQSPLGLAGVTAHSRDAAWTESWKAFPGPTSAARSRGRWRCSKWKPLASGFWMEQGCVQAGFQPESSGRRQFCRPGPQDGNADFAYWCKMGRGQGRDREGRILARADSIGRGQSRREAPSQTYTAQSFVPRGSGLTRRGVQAPPASAGLSGEVTSVLAQRGQDQTGRESQDMRLHQDIRLKPHGTEHTGTGGKEAWALSPALPAP